VVNHHGRRTSTALPSIVLGRSRVSVRMRQPASIARSSSSASASDVVAGCAGALAGAPPEPGALAELRFHRLARAHSWRA
jgi:hypothetical protein